MTRRGALLGVAFLTGCTGSLFQSKAVVPSVYLLSSQAAPVSGSGPGVPANADRVPADLAVQRPRVRAGLNTDRIAVLYGDHRLDYFAGARWSGPLDEVMQDLAVQAFRSRARLRNVNADTSAFTSGYWLEIDVLDFQAEYSSAGATPTVHVHLVARLGNAGDRHILVAMDTDTRQAAADNRLTPIVDAYEHAVDSALDDIVAQTSRKLSENSEHR